MIYRGMRLVTQALASSQKPLSKFSIFTPMQVCSGTAEVCSEKTILLKHSSVKRHVRAVGRASKRPRVLTKVEDSERPHSVWVVDRHPVRKRLGPDRYDAATGGSPFSTVKVRSEIAKPVRIERHVIIRKCDDRPFCLPNARITRLRQTLAVFKYVTKTSWPLAHGFFDRFARLVGRVVVRRPPPPK